jgi:hypothetical protein
MQPQQKNLFLFFVLSLLIMVSWSALQNTLWPPPKKKNVEKSDESEPALVHPWSGMSAPALAAHIGSMAPLPGVPALGYSSQAASQVALGTLAVKEPERWALKDKEPP